MTTMPQLPPHLQPQPPPQTQPPLPTQPAGPYPPPYGQQPPRPKANAVAVLGAIAAVAMAVGLSVDEDGANQWSRVHAWGVLAIAAAVATLAPAAGRLVAVAERRAARIASVGAGALVLFWVLFTLPYVGSNTSLVVTVAVAAGCGAAWLAPGRDAHQADRPRGW